MSEIVVVDTGSSDGTPEIARRNGARVIDFPWIDDFAAARNHAIEQAGGDWLLYIDADERVRPCDRTVLEAELARPELLAATVEFRPRTGFTAYPETRLLRRDPRIRFHGAMHETFLGDIDRLQRAGAGITGATCLQIDHLGYDGEQTHKLDRNLRLLLKQVAADPDRAYLRWHLGCVYLALDQIDLAEAAWDAGMDVVRSRSETVPEDALCFCEAIKLRWSRGQSVSALLDEAQALQPRNWLLQWLRAKTLAAAGQHDEAVAVFERLAGIDAATLVDGMAYDARIFGAWACAEIGLCMFRQDRFALSADWYARAEKMEPSMQEFRVKRLLAAARR